MNEYRRSGTINRKANHPVILIGITAISTSRDNYPSRYQTAAVTAPDSLIAYTYGAAGCTSCGGGDLPASVSRTDTQGAQNIAYSYDGSLLLTSTWSGPVAGVVARTYDNDFRVSSWSVNGGPAITQTYDADGALTKAGDLNLTYNASTGFLTGASLGVTSDAHTYTNYGEIAAYAATAASQEVYSVSYTRDALGRIESENEIVEGVATQWAYRYDTAGRLVEVLKDGASWSVYRYDSNGNRIEAATQSGLVSGTYDAQDRLLTYGNFAYEYTANGELKTKTDTITGAVTRYAYDVFGNLTRVELPDGRLIEYVIDGANRRVGKKVNGVLVKGWLYKDSLKPIAELDGSGNVVATFVYGSKYNTPDYVIKGGVSYRVISEHLGSPRVIVNSATGAIASRMEYDEFGNVLTDTSAGFIPFGFAGGIYDSDTGLVRFGVRDYDSTVGRWTAKDPIRFDGDGLNIYSYVQNNPIRLIDPKGMASVTNQSSRTVNLAGNPGPGSGSGAQVPLTLDPGETINRYNTKNGVGDVDQIEGKKIIGNDFVPHVNVYDDGNGGLDIAVWPFGPYFTPFNIPTPRFPLDWLPEFNDETFPTIVPIVDPCL